MVVSALTPPFSRASVGRESRFGVRELASVSQKFFFPAFKKMICFPLLGLTFSRGFLNAVVSPAQRLQEGQNTLSFSRLGSNRLSEGSEDGWGGLFEFKDAPFLLS